MKRKGDIIIDRQPSTHERAADFILNEMERAFRVHCPNGRDKSRAAMVNILKYFYGAGTSAPLPAAQPSGDTGGAR